MPHTVLVQDGLHLLADEVGATVRAENDDIGPGGVEHPIDDVGHRVACHVRGIVCLAGAAGLHGEVHRVAGGLAVIEVEEVGCRRMWPRNVDVKGLVLVEGLVAVEA